MVTTLVPSSRTLARYAIRHGLPAVFLRRAAGQGDLVGRLLRERAVAEDPYALYEQVRAGAGDLPYPMPWADDERSSFVETLADYTRHLESGGFTVEQTEDLGDDPVRVFETGPWTRLTSRRGHILVRRKAWTLKA